MSDFSVAAKMDWGEPIINFKFEEDNMSEKINDPVNHPSHYTNGPALGRLECLDITRWLPFDLGNAFKYIWRAGTKDATKTVEDLQKARFYLLDWKDLQTWQKTLYHGRAAAEVLFFKTDYRQWASWRYRALRAILCGDVDEALDAIDRQITSERLARESRSDIDEGFARGYQPEDETDDD